MSPERRVILWVLVFLVIGASLYLLRGALLPCPA